MQFGTGDASFCLSDAQVPDMGDLLTALWGGGDFGGDGFALSPVFPSTVSMEARWYDGDRVERLRDQTNQFEYLHRRTSASIKNDLERIAWVRRIIDATDPDLSRFRDRGGKL